MNFYDVLAAKNWSGGIPTINFFDLLFAQSMGGAERWETYEGTLPATIISTGADMRQYQVWGNTGGVGDRTENLFNAEIVQGGFVYASGAEANANNRIRSTLMDSKLPAGTYTISSTGMTYVGIYSYDDNGFVSAQSFRDFVTIPYTFTITEPVYVRFVWRNASNTAIVPDDISNVMLTEGSTAPASFVPYGYKLDMGISDSSVKQLFNEIYPHIDATARYMALHVGEGSFTLSTNMPLTSQQAANLFLLAGNVTTGASTSTNGVYNGRSWSVTAINGYITIAYREYSGVDPRDYHVMLNAGSTPLPYQPYFNTTTPVYIGDEPLEKVGNYADYADYQKQKVVREIKKYVFNGTENWEQVLGAGEDSTKNYFRFTLSSATYLNANFSRCSHFTWQWINTSTTAVGFRTYIPTGSNAILFVVRPENVEDIGLSDFKLWLAEQYAAGTPVTLWCALTTAEEEDPPVTLPVLPTVEGETVVDYAGESVAPEKVLLEYKKGGD